MKANYILKCYDKLLRDINNPKHIDDKKCIEDIQKFATESFVSYKVIFKKRNNSNDFIIEYPIHNLYPHAINFENLKSESHPQLEKFIPSILKELNLQDTNLKLHWSSQSGLKILYLLVDAKLESLSKINLLFIYYYQIVKNENINIKNCLKEKIFKYQSKNQIEQFIYKIQLSIENLIEITINQIKPNSVQELYKFSNQYNKTDHLKIIYIYLEKLLRFLEKEFSIYTSENSRVPFRTLMLEKQRLEPKLQFIESKFVESCSNEKLLTIALDPIGKIAAIVLNNKIDYYEFKYCKKYISACFDYFTMMVETTESNVIDLIFELDLNSLKLFEYKIDTIISDLNQLDSTNDKINLLYEKRKNINQSQIKILKSYFRDYPSIKTQAIGWIEEEIEFLNKNLKLKNINQTVQIEDKEKTKIHTDFSVAQLSYFFNILHQSGVIKHSNQRDIFRFIAENFKTKTTEQISVDSIKSRYYNVESNTKSVVREKIIDLLNLAKS